MVGKDDKSLENVIKRDSTGKFQETWKIMNNREKTSISLFVVKVVSNSTQFLSPHFLSEIRRFVFNFRSSDFDSNENDEFF